MRVSKTLRGSTGNSRRLNKGWALFEGKKVTKGVCIVAKLATLCISISPTTGWATGQTENTCCINQCVKPQPCSSSSFRERHFLYSPEFWCQSGPPGLKASSRRQICGPSFSLDNLRLSGLLEGRPLWVRAVYTA